MRQIRSSGSIPRVVVSISSQREEARRVKRPLEEEEEEEETSKCEKQKQNQNQNEEKTLVKVIKSTTLFFVAYLCAHPISRDLASTDPMVIFSWYPKS